jgi:hypothetical protein
MDVESEYLKPVFSQLFTTTHLHIALMRDNVESPPQLVKLLIMESIYSPDILPDDKKGRVYVDIVAIFQFFYNKLILTVVEGQAT